MDEAKFQNSPPAGSFFASPDDEDDATMAIDGADRSSPSVPQTPKTSSAFSSPPQEKLFLDDSDDEIVIPEEDFLTLKRSQAVMMEDTSDVEIVEQTSKADHNPGESSSHLPPSLVSQKSSDLKKAQKKRRLSPQVEEAQPLSGLLPAYLGEVLIPNAWSTISGRGYVKANDIIHVKRDHDEESTVRSKSKSSQNVNSKKKSDKKKQVTLTSMIVAQHQKVAKKKRLDTIVRLVTEDGVGQLFLSFMALFGTILRRIR